MSSILALPDQAALRDLQVLLDRAALADDSAAARLILENSVLAVYVSVLHPRGLLDSGPTVLGLRTVEASGDDLDVVVPIRSLQVLLNEALAEAHDDAAQLTVPTSVNTVMWAAISPPRGGWERMGSIDPSVFDAAARAGIAEVATAVPGALGSDLVHRVRSEVWGAPLDGFEHVPAGAAFAALSLGFLGDDVIEQYGSGSWLRFSTQRGHVLVKHVGWSRAL
jgi:hypothetical protein